MLKVECASGCQETTHVLIEVWYDATPALWGLFQEQSHEQIFERTKMALRTYNDEIDDESVFYLMPAIPAVFITVDDVEERVRDEIRMLVVDEEQPDA